MDTSDGNISRSHFSWELFWAMPIVGILRGFSLPELEPLLSACFDGGLRNVEITMNSEGAPEQIRKARDLFQGRMNIGVGTVCTRKDLEIALDAGASFVITPGLFPEVILECKRLGIPIFPGSFTPTEIYTAWNLGADIVKVFPAGGLGANYFRDIRGPFPQIRLMPTGGVTPETLEDFALAGACAFSVGSQLFDKERIKHKDWQWLQARTSQFVAMYYKSKR